MLNGAILGVFSIFIQKTIYYLLEGKLIFSYATSSALTYSILVGVNFIIQKKLIFERDGLFYKFLLSNLLILLLVSSLAEVILLLFTVADQEMLGEHFAFVTAALLGAYPSYLVKKNFVFPKMSENTC